MALIKCPDCGKDVSTEAATCPHCGRPVTCPHCGHPVKTSGEIDRVKKYDTVVSSGQSALRALLTLDGGATIAFLTFIGHLWDKGTLSSESSHLFVAALQMFIYGTLLVVLAYGTIFLTNCFSSEKWERTANALFGVTVVLGIISVGCFLVASWRAVEGLQAATKLI